MKGVNAMKTWKAVAIALLTVAAPALGQSDIVVDFYRDAVVDKQAGNPPGFRDTPMVTLGGVAEYSGNPWEVMVAWDANTTNCPGQGLPCPPGWETYQQGGNGTITFDLIPPIPAGQYYLYLSMNVANWNNGSPVGIQLGGIGIEELGNESPGAMHYFYPSSNPGAADPVGDMEIAGPHMGPGSEYMVNSSGVNITFESNGLPLPTGSRPSGFNDGNSFPTSAIVAPDNQIVLTMYDGAALNYSVLRGYSLRFEYVAPYYADFTDVTVNNAGAICFESVPGGTYSLQYSNAVTTTGWVNAGASITATDTNAYLFDPTEPAGSDPTNKTYRVIAE